MARVWWQGLAVSLAVHATVLASGWLWTLLSHPEPPDPAPIEARLVAPQPEPEQPEPGRPEPKEPAPEPPAPKSEPEAPEPEPQAAEPEPEPKPEPEPASQAVAKAEPEPEEASEPATKTPKQPVPKKRIAQPDAAEPEPEQAEPDKPAPQTAEPEAKDPAPEADAAEPKEPEPILGEALSDKIAKLSEGGGSARGSLRQRQAVARFQEAVRSRVQGNWLVPPGLEGREDLEATVRIALTPAGELAAPPKVVASNGPGYFNSSVVRAVEKAAPFPMPDGPTQYFQNLELHFSPDMVQ